LANKRWAKERNQRISHDSSRSCIRTNTIKVKTDKQEGKATCRKSKNIEETVTHIISECSKLIQKNRRLEELGLANSRRAKERN